MAAFLFPVIVKVLLSKEGYYQLTEDDEGALRAIDKLLVVNKWATSRLPQQRDRVARNSPENNSRSCNAPSDRERDR